ncbi:MBL fold metallo-hydrolase [Leekyejoonella antrihumi]|uniref:MBL fold metallo-hydrolase n=1 Tax=Leekyejoonella antrihumi TaxID=1660198 RepID=A0A563DZ75_9MICO|nr:MBL fold metallo-hydrolase [Leekyejoonella antrihumi]TWP34954.1 MBL fold metallo-hydrolase [Leekyejoonella antrihumi]
MLREVAPGVLVRQSAFCLSNAVIVLGDDGVLLIDPGISGADLTDLASELHTRGLVVAAGFATHPHWDHVLWHEAFGTAPRFASRTCVEHIHTDLEDARGKAGDLAPGAPLDLLGDLTPLPDGPRTLPWVGPRVHLVEHQAHAPGHVALLVEGAGVLVAGDMLSDVEIPLLDLDSPDPVAAYAEGLDRLSDLASTGARLVVPGHGAAGDAQELRRRLALDRDYLRALESGGGEDDPRLGPDTAYGRDWLLRDHGAQVAVGRRGHA